MRAASRLSEAAQFTFGQNSSFTLSLKHFFLQVLYINPVSRFETTQDFTKSIKYLKTATMSPLSLSVYKLLVPSALSFFDFLCTIISEHLS